MIAKSLRALIKWWDAQQEKWYQDARADIHERLYQRRGKVRSEK